MKAELILRWFLIVLGVLWLGAGTWYEFLRYEEGFEFREQMREERFQQKIKDCRGSFSARYECKNAAIRKNQLETFKIWVEKLSVVCAPPVVVFLGYIGVIYIIERRREAARIRRRRKRYFGS